MTPRMINAHKQGYKLKAQEQNAMYHLEGIYTREALLATVGNMFKKKGAKAYEYPEKPFEIGGNTETDDQGINTGALTEAEKKRRTEALFGQLRLMQANFELSKLNSNTRDDE